MLQVFVMNFMCAKLKIFAVQCCVATLSNYEQGFYHCSQCKMCEAQLQIERLRKIFFLSLCMMVLIVRKLCTLRLLFSCTTSFYLDRFDVLKQYIFELQTG